MAKLTMLKSGCPQCDLIDKARQSTLKSALASIRYEFPKPTLGIKKVMAIIEADIHD
jgi:hypothetical protein